MIDAFGLLLASALVPTVLFYGIGLILLRRLRLAGSVQVLGFAVAWILAALTALVLAERPSVQAAQSTLVLGALVAATVVVLGVAIAGRRSVSPAQTAVTGADSRACPFCAEQIRAAAVVCRFCNREVEPTAPRDQSERMKQNIEECSRTLADLGYRVIAKDSGWEIREPLGGRARISSVDDLIEYARSKQLQNR